MKRRLRTLAMALVVITVLLAGCGSNSTAPAQTSAKPSAATSSPAGATDGTIKVGILTSLTGSVSLRVVTNIERFIRMGIDDVNARGGVKVGGKTYRLEGVTADDKGTAEGAREAANRLVLSDKVKFIMGGGGTQAAGAQTVSEPNKVMLICVAAVPNSLGPSNPLTFMMLSDKAMRAGAAVDWLIKEHPQAKRVAVVGSDDVDGRGQTDQSEAVAKSKGLTVVAKEFYPLDIKDFTPLVTRLLRQNPDAIDTGSTGSRPALFAALMKSLYEQGFKGPVFGGSADVNSMKQGGPSMEGFVVPMLTDYKAPVVGAKEKAVLQQYVDKFGEAELEPSTLVNYQAPLIVAQAMEKAGTVDDTVKIAQVMRDGEWDTLFGKGRFVGTKTYGLAVVPEQPIYVSKVQGGKLITFDSVNGTLP